MAHYLFALNSKVSSTLVLYVIIAAGNSLLNLSYSFFHEASRRHDFAFKVMVTKLSSNMMLVSIVRLLTDIACCKRD